MVNYLITKKLQKHGYQVQERIGKGAFGTCWRIWSQQYKQTFVCKVMQVPSESKSKMEESETELIWDDLKKHISPPEVPIYARKVGIARISRNEEVMNELSGPGGDFEGINAYIPRTDNKNDEVFKYDAKTRTIIAELFSKVKVAASNAC